jgi:predicted  nucleic acid-binding Zn-ribbon protein
MAKAKTDEAVNQKELTVVEKLTALTRLQLIDTKIDKLRNVRGELPLEVQDLEDEIEGLSTRLENLEAETTELENQIASKNKIIQESKDLIKKYEDQRNNVRNNREYDSLTKEIEYQELEIQLAEKRINEYTYKLDVTRETIEQSKDKHEERQEDLKSKQEELKEIVAETENEEKILLEKSEQSEAIIEARLLNAYKRIRKNARNGLAVVPIERDACGGCFNKIPPQRQLDIRIHNKIIVCEYCGRVLVDDDITNLASENL